MGKRRQEAPPSWWTLPNPALYNIVTRLKSLTDYYAFGGVCVAWRSVSRDAMKEFMRSQPPLLFIIHCHSDSRFSVYSPSEGKACKFWFPLPDRWQTCVGFQHGYLVMADTWVPRAAPRQALLVHPFTGDTVALPHNPGTFNSVALSSSPADPGCRVLMHNVLSRHVWYCQPGDTGWSAWECSRRIHRVAAVERRFFLLLADQTVAILDFLPHGPQVTLEVKTRNPAPWFTVASGAELLGLRCHPCDIPHGQKIYRLDLAGGRWAPTESLEDQALFLGFYPHGVSATPAAWGGRPGRVHSSEWGTLVRVHRMGKKMLVHEEDSWHRDPLLPSSAVWVLPSLCF